MVEKLQWKATRLIIRLMFNSLHHTLPKLPFPIARSIWKWSKFTATKENYSLKRLPGTMFAVIARVIPQREFSYLHANHSRLPLYVFSIIFIIILHRKVLDTRNFIEAAASFEELRTFDVQKGTVDGIIFSIPDNFCWIQQTCLLMWLLALKLTLRLSTLFSSQSTNFPLRFPRKTKPRTSTAQQFSFPMNNYSRRFKRDRFYRSTGESIQFSAAGNNETFPSGARRDRVQGRPRLSCTKHQLTGETRTRT